MKKLFSVIVLTAFLFSSILTVSVSAAKYSVENITFSAGPEFTVHTSEDLLSSSNVQGLLFAAITADSAHQIQARVTETEFSKRLKSFSGLDSEIIAPVGKQIFPNGYETTQINSAVFLKSTVAGQNGCTSIYVTVNKGKLYTFTYFGSDATKMGEFMSTVKMPADSSAKRGNVYVMVLISIFILADIVLIVFLVYSFIKDQRQRKMEANENVVSQYIKIKRRKF